MRTILVTCLGAAFVLGSMESVHAQTPPASPGASPRPVVLDSAFLSGWQWRNIGPDRGGRSIAV